MIYYISSSFNGSKYDTGYIVFFVKNIKSTVALNYYIICVFPYSYSFSLRFLLISFDEDFNSKIFHKFLSSF